MNRFSNVEGVTGGGGIKFIKEAYIKKPATSVPRFDGTDECDELELSNFSALDDNMKNMISGYEEPSSNFCPQGYDVTTKSCILLPSRGQMKSNAIGKQSTLLDYSARFDGTDESKKETQKPEINAIKSDSNGNTERKILGMKPKVAYGVGAVVLITAGVFVYIKYFKK